MVLKVGGWLLITWIAIAVVFQAHAATQPTPAAVAVHSEEVSVPREFWRNGKEGWFWYEDPEFFEEPPPEERQVVDRLLKIEKAEELREEVQRLRNVAIMEPTVGNVKTYLYAQQFIMNKASTFADTWRRVVWQTPDLDYSLVRPVNAMAVNQFKDDRRETESRFISDLGKQGYGIFFFYSSTCPYCHSLAPTLRMFENQYGMRVMAISVDGGPIEGFPDAKNDNGIAQGLGVETVPALYLVNGNEKTILPIGFGLLSMSDIIDRINVLLTSTPGTRW